MRKLLNRIIAVVLTMVLLFGAAPISGIETISEWLSLRASAATYSGNCGADGADVTWNLDTETGELTISGTGAMKDYSSSNVPWRSYRSYIKTVTINSGVTSIGSYAFYECTVLLNIIIPDTVTSIGMMSFYKCAMLTDITIPDGVPYIVEYAFAFCTALSNIIIPDSVTNIGRGVFDSCTNLASVTLGINVKSIGEMAFRSCLTLSNIIIPESVTNIGGGAFVNCTGLTGFFVDAGNTAYSTDVNGVLFNYAKTKLICFPAGSSTCTEYVIPSSVTSIADSAFYECTGLTNVIVPDSVTSIGGFAFLGVGNIVYSGSASDSPGGATNVNKYVEENFVFSSAEKTTLLWCNRAVETVTIPDSVTSIKKGAFKNCTSLEAITLPFVGLSPDATNEDSVFGAIFADYIPYDSLELVKIRQYYSSSSAISYYIPSSLRRVILTNCTSIPYGAFYNCTMLTEITIPDSVTSIDSYAFYNCTGLTSVTIPDSVTSINSYVISGCTSLSSATLGESIQTIGNNAFSGCAVLANVTIPDSVTSIGASAFSGCTNLAAATLGESVQTIGNNAFSGCTALANITIPDSVTSIGTSAFSGCTNLATATLGESIQTIGNNAFSGCTALANTTIPDSVTSIGTSAFSGCTNLAAATLGENVQTIGNGAFYNCSSLATITVPNSVVNIGNYAFQSCTSLTSAALGTGIQTIGTNAFDGCTALESFVLNAEACGTMGTSIAPVFSNCPSLKSVTIGDAATMIPDYAFYNCTSLERVTVGENVHSIGTKAFYNCSALRRIQFRGGKVDIAYDAFDYCGEYALCCSENSYWQAYAIRKGIQYVLVDETSETEFTIENGVLLAYDGTAAKITLPSCVTLVDYEAFRGNEVITRVAMSESVTQISNYAFADCRNLAEVFIPDTVTSIGTNAFSGSHPTIICIENSYAHRFATAHNMTVKFVRILIDLENAVMRVEIPYDDEPEVSLVHLTGVSLSVIGLGSMPAKTSYRVGETLDTSGLSLEAHYTNGMTSVLRDGFSVSQPIFSEPGEQTVTLDYCGQTVEFTVTVTDEVVSGDADQSGTLDLKDIALVTRSLAGGWDVDLSDVDVDVNKDGEVNLKDAVLLRRYLAGGWGVQLA